MTIIISCNAAFNIGLDQMSYSIGEEGGSLQACVVILPGGPSLQNAGLTLDISVAATGDTTTGEYTYYYGG